MKKTYILAALLTLLSFPAFATVDRIDPNAMEITPTGSSITDRLADWLGAFPSGNISIDADRVITGTTDTIQASDGGKYLRYQSALPVSVSLPAASSTGFTQGFGFEGDNQGVGLVSMTSTGSLINNIVTLNVEQGDGCLLRSDGSNYYAALSSCPSLSTHPIFETRTLTSVDTRLNNTNGTSGICSYYNASGNIAYTTAGQCDARFTYNPTNLSYLGMLVEGSSTNVTKYSNGDASWLKSNTVLVTSTATSPDGTLNAFSLTDNDTSGSHYTGESFLQSWVSGAPYTCSLFVKPDTATAIQLTFTTAGFGSNAWANFNLSTGEVGTKGSAATSEIQALQNGWFRIAATAPATAPASTGSCNIVMTNSSSTAARLVSYVGSGQTLYGFGFQVEQGSVSSLMPTTGSVASRSSDVITFTNPYWFTDTVGTLCADFILKTNASGQVVFGDTAEANSMLKFATATNAGSYDGTNTVDYALAFADAGSLNKACVRYGSSASNVSVNGTLGTAGTFDNDFGITGVRFFSDYNNENRVVAYLQNVTWYNYALSDSQMIAKTTP